MLAFVLLILALWLAAIFPVVWIGGVLLDAVRGGPLEEIVSTSIFVVWLMAPIVIAGRIAREIPRAQEGMPRPLFYRVLDALGALARIRHGL